MNRLAIVVLNWNGADDTMECMDSLLTQSSEVPSIILVDNASSDDSVVRLEKYIEQHNSPIHLIKNKVNYGFAGGINTGFKYALSQDFTYVGILNPDAVADKNWTSNLVAELESNADTGLVAGLMLRRDGKTIDSAGDFYSTWGLAFPRNRDDPRNSAPTEPEYIFGATGGAVIFKVETLKKIGLFDEKFFMYYEDVDLSFRAQIAGYRVRYSPDAIAYHAQGSSTKKVPGLAVYNTFKNLPMLAYKNIPTALLWKILPRFWLVYLLIYLNSFRRGNGWSATRGLFKGLALIPHAVRERRNIQKHRKVNADYINSVIWHGLPPVESGLLKLFKPRNTNKG